MTAKTARHRWKATSDHFYPGPKCWECIQCGLQKVTEWEEKPRYSMRGREWYRFAPPCPPDEPNSTASKNHVGPTFVAKFSDHVTTRMTVFTPLEKLDWGRGVRLSQAAYQSRWRTQRARRLGKASMVDAIAPVPPVIVSAHFERNGKVLAVAEAGDARLTNGGASA